MSASSSSRSALSKPGPYIPIIKCETCGRIVQRKVSNTVEHDGWMFFRCERHGRGYNLWHWELEYVFCLVDNGYLRGDDGMEALGWAHHGREDFVLRKAEMKAKMKAPGKDEQMMKMGNSIEDKVKEVVLPLKLVLVSVAILFVVLVVKK